MTKKLLLTLLFLLNIFFLGAINAEACSCMMMSSCEAYARAKIVFTGKIIKAEAADRGLRHQVQVEENFLGMDNVTLTDVYTDNASSCMFEMEAGKDYLIYAWRNEKDGQLWTGMCSHTAPIENAEEDLKYIRSIKNSGETGGTIKGRVVDAESTREEPKKPENVDKVFVESQDGEKFEAGIEANGSYELGGLKQGKYNIFITPPKGYTTNYDADPYFDDSDERKFTEVSGQGCSVKDFEVKIDGVIGGKVFDADGNPVKERRVNLYRLIDPNKAKSQTDSNRQTEISVEDSDEADSPKAASKIEESFEEKYEADYDDYTDEDGSYNFKGLPPGRYLLGVEIGDFLNINSNEDQYSPTFFPNSRKRETAIIIDLKKSEILTDKNIQLFPKLKKRIVTGRVQLKNGRAISKIESSIYAKREGNSDTEWIGDLKIDAKGNFVFEAFEETEYLIQVRHYTGKKIDGLIEEGFSNNCFIIPKNGQLKPVKIILEKGTANCDETEFRGR